MASIVRIPPAARSSLKLGPNYRILFPNYRNGARIPLVDPDGHPLAGIVGCHGVRTEKPDGTHLGCDFIWLDPESGFPMHTHAGDHVLYVIRGAGFVHIDGRDIGAGMGDLIHIPAEYPHRVFTSGSALLIAAFGHPHKAIDSKDRMDFV
jgi:mannose-6-phosphate isomerase-like protein (cupin superfamily)